MVALPLGTDSLVESYRLPRLVVWCVLMLWGVVHLQRQVDALTRSSIVLLGVIALGALGVDDLASSIERLALVAAGVVTIASAQLQGEPLRRGAIVGGLAVAVLTIIEACSLVKLSVSGLGPSGGTGSRNAAAHVLALVLPLVWSRTRASRWWFLGLAVLVLALVWTRSRAGWLAALLVVSVLSVHEFKRTRSWVPLTAALLGVGLGLVVPNALHWRSPTPYVDSARRLFAVQEGSGAGRLRQAKANLTMIAAHPLGVGPGQWRVEYPRFAARDDLERSADEPCAREPLNDLTAMPAELGVLGALGVMLWLVQWWRSRPLSDVQLATLGCVAVLVVGDSVLTSAPTAFLAALGLSASAPVGPVRPLGRPAFVALVAVLLAGAVVASTRAVALAAVTSATVTPQSLERAAALAPFEYRARLAWAEYLAGVKRCDEACREASEAAALRPAYEAPRFVLASCQCEALRAR